MIHWFFLKSTLLNNIFQLSGSSDVATNAVKILDVLIRYLVTEHIDYSIEIGLQGRWFINITAQGQASIYHQYFLNPFPNDKF